MMKPNSSLASTGMLAERYCSKVLPLQVLQSAAGFYIGTADDSGPCSRESVEYFRKEMDAAAALNTGKWTQKADV